MKFSFVQNYRGEYPIDVLCKTLGVSKSGYYDWKRKQIAKGDSPEKDYKLRRDIEDIFRSSNGAYGSPRVFQIKRGLVTEWERAKLND